MPRNRTGRMIAAGFVSLLAALAVGGCGKAEQKPGVSGLPITTTSPTTSTATEGPGGGSGGDQELLDEETTTGDGATSSGEG